VALLGTNHKCTHPCLLLLRSKRCEVVEDGDDARHTQPPIDCLWSWRLRFELYNSDRIVSLFMFLYGYCYCYSLMSIVCMKLDPGMHIGMHYSLMSTVCMKLDPGMHIGMHLVCFTKTRCDIFL
jgi:hypothetical protein